MVDSQLDKRVKTYLKAANQRFRRRHRAQSIFMTIVGILAAFLAITPDGKPDMMRIGGLALIAWSLYFLLAPLRRRATERYHEHERAHFLQMVPETSPAYPEALRHLVRCGAHKKLARALVERLPGGPELLEDTADGEIFFEAPKQKQEPVAEPIAPTMNAGPKPGQAKTSTTKPTKTKNAVKPPPAPSNAPKPAPAGADQPAYMPLDPIKD